MTTLEHYRSQPYQRVFEIRCDAGERYFLYRIVEIPTIAGDGLTKDEALANRRSAFDDYVTWALEEDLDIPQPARPVVPSVSNTETRTNGGAAGQAATSGPATRLITAIAA